MGLFVWRLSSSVVGRRNHTNVTMPTPPYRRYVSALDWFWPTPWLLKNIREPCHPFPLSNQDTSSPPISDDYFAQAANGSFVDDREHESHEQTDVGSQVRLLPIGHLKPRGKGSTDTMHKLNPREPLISRGSWPYVLSDRPEPRTALIYFLLTAEWLSCLVRDKPPRTIERPILVT